jgi:ligand-binding sensor domain-containing protein
VDRNGSIWVAATNGLFRGTAGSNGWIWTRQRIPDTIDSEVFAHVLEDRQGRIWAGGSEGLAVWDGHTWLRTAGADGARIRFALSLAEGPDGSIWVAYRNAGNIDRVAVDRNGTWTTSRVLSDSSTQVPDTNRFLGFDRD